MVGEAAPSFDRGKFEASSLTMLVGAYLRE